MVDRSVNLGSITRTRRYQRTNVIIRLHRKISTAEPEQAEVERVREDLADLVAVLPEHEPQEPERQRDQAGVDDRAEPGMLRLHVGWRDRQP